MGMFLTINVVNVPLANKLSLIIVSVNRSWINCSPAIVQSSAGALPPRLGALSTGVRRGRRCSDRGPEVIFVVEAGAGGRLSRRFTMKHGAHYPVTTFSRKKFNELVWTIAMNIHEIMSHMDSSSFSIVIIIAHDLDLLVAAIYS